jgi:hypothetical protein
MKPYCYFFLQNSSKQKMFFPFGNWIGPSTQCQVWKIFHNDDECVCVSVCVYVYVLCERMCMCCVLYVCMHVCVLVKRL